MITFTESVIGEISIARVSGAAVIIPILERAIGDRWSCDPTQLDGPLINFHTTTCMVSNYNQVQNATSYNYWSLWNKRLGFAKLFKQLCLDHLTKSCGTLIAFNKSRDITQYPFNKTVGAVKRLVPAKRYIPRFAEVHRERWYVTIW